MAKNDRVTRRLVVRGQVQGVWYRESMRIEAGRLGVRGWVRNRLDGTVEALVQGEAHAVEAIVRWAWRGPERAQVSAVEASDLHEAPAFERFEKRPTA